MQAATFAAYALALLFAHHLGDYWIQTHHQAMTKGQPGPAGVRACLGHVATYTFTTAAFGSAVWVWLELDITLAGFVAGQVVSAVTHYWADRRHTLAGLARRLGKSDFYDNGGAAHLDQSWHWTWLFIAAVLTTAI